MSWLPRGCRRRALWLQCEENYASYGRETLHSSQRTEDGTVSVHLIISHSRQSCKFNTTMAGNPSSHNLHIPAANRITESSVHDPAAGRWRVFAGPVAVFWDIENCPVPGDVNAEDVAGNIRMALRVHPAIKGAVTAFSAYGDFNRFPRRLREGCQRTGVNLIDVPNGRKDASDKAILVDMFLFALDNPPPCTILLISGDVDFAPALHKLGQRGYTVVLAIPAGVGVSSALCNAGRFVWDWPSVARGEGLVPAKVFSACFTNSTIEDTLTNLGSHSMVGASCFSSDDSDLPYEDEHLAYWRFGSNYNQRFPLTYSQELPTTLELAKPPVSVRTLSESVVLPGFSGLSVSQEHVQPSITSKPQRLSSGQAFTLLQKHQLPNTNVATSTLRPPVSACSGQLAGQGESLNCLSTDCAPAAFWVQPGDIQGLKCQLVKLLEQNGGKLKLLRIPSEYCKLFGRPLYLAEYGSSKLVHLIERMTDAFSIKGEGNRRTLHLKKRLQEVVHAPRRPRSGHNFNHKGKDMGKAGKFSLTNGLRNFGEVTFLQDTKTGEPLPEDTGNSFGDIIVRHESESFSDDEKESDQQGEYGDENAQESSMLQVDFTAEEYAAAVRLEVFRQELQELLVSHACKILLTSFLTFYRQKYSCELDFSAFGVQELEALFEKVKDVVVLKEEDDTGRRFLVANCISQVGEGSI